MSFTVYPAIDLRGGKVVRLEEGDPARIITYNDDPAEVASRWLHAGAPWLHVVNLDGAFGENDNANRAALEKVLNVAERFNARIQFGGGLRSLDALERAMESGVSRVVLGTIALEQADVVTAALQTFGPGKVAIGIDARDGMVRVRGWKEGSGISASDLAIQMRNLGVHTVIFTDVSRDGLGSGLNIPATKQLAEVSGLDVIASGGVHSLQDVIAARDAHLVGVIIGRALYEGMIDLKDVVESLC